MTLVAAKLAGCVKSFCDGTGTPCEELYPFYVKKDLCTGCGVCLKKCGKKAFHIKGGRNTVSIDPFRCIQCGACLIACENAGYFAVIETQVANGFTYEIDPEACARCLNCFRVCPVEPEKAIVQSTLERTRVDQAKCSHCGECVELQFCPFGAIHEKR